MLHSNSNNQASQNAGSTIVHEQRDQTARDARARSPAARRGGPLCTNRCPHLHAAGVVASRPVVCVSVCMCEKVKLSLVRSNRKPPHLPRSWGTLSSASCSFFLVLSYVPRSCWPGFFCPGLMPLRPSARDASCMHTCVTQPSLCVVMMVLEVVTMTGI